MEEKKEEKTVTIVEKNEELKFWMLFVKDRKEKEPTRLHIFSNKTEVIKTFDELIVSEEPPKCEIQEVTIKEKENGKKEYSIVPANMEDIIYELGKYRYEKEKR